MPEQKIVQALLLTETAKSKRSTGIELNDNRWLYGEDVRSIVAARLGANLMTDLTEAIYARPWTELLIQTIP